LLTEINNYNLLSVGY